MNYTYNLLRDELVRDEGYREKPYRDSLGKLTIGVGFNLDDVGLLPEEITYILQHRIKLAENDLDRNIPWWRDLSDARQRALVNLNYNLGWSKLSGFKNLLAHLQSGNFDQAADDALHSLWASQVGSRAQRIATLIRNG